MLPMKDFGFFYVLSDCIELLDICFSDWHPLLTPFIFYSFLDFINLNTLDEFLEKKLLIFNFMSPYVESDYFCYWLFEAIFLSDC